MATFLYHVIAGAKIILRDEFWKFGRVYNGTF